MATTILMHSIPESPRIAINISSRKSVVRELFPANHSPRLAPQVGLLVKCMTEVSTDFTDVFAFSVPAPERINGRLAIIGFLTAIAVELIKGQDLFAQINEGGIPWFIGTSTLLSVASLVPLFQGVTAESKTDSSMSSDAESWDGRCRLLNEFCMKGGIVKHRTSVNEPQQVAKLMSRTLLEMAHKMLSSAGMARRFLADALSMTSYLMNRSLSTAIECRTLEEMWSGNVANYSVLRIFGCPCYVRVSDGKLNGRTRKCIFLGYAQGEWGYKLQCPELNSPVISREVTFDESPVLLGRSVCGSVHMDLNGIQLEVELQPETPKVAGISEVIDIHGAYSEVEPIELIVAVTANIDKMRIRSPDRYGCNDGFALSAVEEVVSENSYGAVKGACGVGVLTRPTVIAKFKRGLGLKDVCGS